MALLAAVATGCRDVDDSLQKIVSDRVELTDAEVVLPSAGRTESTIVTTDLGWTIEGGAEWCEVLPKSGGPGTSTIYFTTVPNPEHSDRSVNYTLVSGEKRTVVTVYQKKKDEIVFDKDKFDNIPMDGGEITVEMNTNVAYTIDFPEGSAEWIEHLPAAGEGGTRAMERRAERFRIAPTQEWDERMGLIVFIREDERTRDTVRVFQVQRDKIILTPNVIRPVIEGQTIRVELRSNIEYDIAVGPEYTDWLSFTTDQRPDVLMVTATQTNAERYGEIVISDRNNPAFEAVLEVYQVEEDMVLFEEELLEIEREGGTYALDVLDNVDGNYELVIPKYATWITQAPTTRAMESSRVSIVVAENPDGQIERRAKLFLKGTVNEQLVSVPIQITQVGREVLANDIDVLKMIQQIMGLSHANWPGGSNNLQSFGGGSPMTITNRQTIAEGTKTITVGGTVTEFTLPSSSYSVRPVVLPEIVGDLQDLTRITISGFYEGDLPISIGSLPLLKTMTISARTATGLGLKGIPKEYGGLETLTSLTIQHDFSYAGNEADLETMLDFIGELTNLTSLTIANCNYGTRMPESWRNLKKLTTLNLQHTGFTDLGPISEMVALQTLSITNDAIVDLPDMSALTQLKTVTLSNNADLKQIPASLMACSSMTSLTISNNALESLPDDWSALVNMTTLNLSQSSSHPHRIADELPESMGVMTKLTSFNVSNNALTGQIPATFGNLVNLSGTSGFNIQNNKFTGIAEGLVSKWTKITGLTLNNNSLVGLPADIGQMTWLTTLNATNNEFTGDIPESIGSMENLQTLNLSRDPALEFTNPGLGGFIPESLTNLAKLRTLNLSGNNLVGPIPSNIGDMPHLYELRLNDNNLSGEIPISLTELDGYTTLPSPPFKVIYLQNNNLSGYIPDAFRNMEKLNILDLRNNNLQGSVPSGLVAGPGSFPDGTSILHLSGNRLTGVVPPELRTKMMIVHRTTWEILEQQEGYGLTVE